MVKAVVLSLAAVSLSCASEWFYTSSPNFEVYTAGDPREARRICEYFEQVRDFFMRAKSSELTTRLPVTVVVFKNSTDFKPYAIRSGIPAYYAGAQNRDYIVMSGAGEEQFPVAVHEYVHLLVRHSGVRLPVWLNEGLAEVYSTLKPQFDRVLVGVPPTGRLMSLKRDRWLPFARLLAIDELAPEYNEQHRAGILYAQGWLLVHMLMFDEYTREGYPRFMDAIAEGRSAAEAFDLVWKMPVDYMGKKLEAYARRAEWNGTWYDVRLQKIPVMEPRAATAIEVEINLATLAGLLNRQDEAIGRLRALVEKNPKSWRAHEALAVTLWMKHDMSGAREHFRKATELNSPNWKTWFDYALVMYGLHDDFESAIRALRRTLELNPENIEAQVMLAEEYNYASRYREAIAAVQAMKRIEPQLAARAFLASASAHAQLGQDAEARAELERARGAAKELWEQRRVEDLARSLEVRARAAAAPTPAVTSPGPAIGSPAAPAREKITGEFRELECLGLEARLKIATPQGIKRLLIRDPSRITVRGQGPSAVLSCGPQTGRKKITVEFVPKADQTHGTSGDVRAVEFL